jgi:beta-aspartyl-dipeptidase (metallo-type)
LDLVLPLVTTNPARMLKLAGKGRIAAGCDADVLVLERGLAIREVIARGQRMVIEGEPAKEEKFLEESKRSIELVGGKLEE